MKSSEAKGIAVLWFQALKVLTIFVRWAYHFQKGWRFLYIPIFCRRYPIPQLSPSCLPILLQTPRIAPTFWISCMWSRNSGASFNRLPGLYLAPRGPEGWTHRMPETRGPLGDLWSNTPCPPCLHQDLAGWWYTLPLWKIWRSVGVAIPNIWGWVKTLVPSEPQNSW